MARGRESTAQGAILVSHTGREKEGFVTSSESKDSNKNDILLQYLNCQMNFYIEFFNVMYAAMSYYILVKWAV